MVAKWVVQSAAVMVVKLVDGKGDLWVVRKVVVMAVQLVVPMVAKWVD